MIGPFTWWQALFLVFAVVSFVAFMLQRRRRRLQGKPPDQHGL